MSKTRAVLQVPFPNKSTQTSNKADDEMSKLHKIVVGWLVVLRIYVALAVFQPYRDLEAGDKIQVARPEIEPRDLFLRKPRSSLTTGPPLHKIVKTDS